MNPCIAMDSPPNERIATGSSRFCGATVWAVKTPVVISRSPAVMMSRAGGRFSNASSCVVRVKKITTNPPTAKIDCMDENKEIEKGLVVG